MKLKPCPFCGSNNVFLEFAIDAFNHGKLIECETFLSARIWCDDCDASVSVPGYSSTKSEGADNDFFIYHSHNGERVSFEEDTLERLKRDVMDKWNTRGKG